MTCLSSSPNRHNPRFVVLGMVFGIWALGGASACSSGSGGGSSTGGHGGRGSGAVGGAVGAKGGATGTASGGAGGNAAAGGGNSGSAGAGGGADAGTGGASASGGAGGASASGGAGGASASGGAGGALAGGAGRSGTGGTGAGTGGAGGGSAGADLRPLVTAFCAAARTCCTKDAWPDTRLDSCESAAAVALDTPGLAAGRVNVKTTSLAACVNAYQHAATSCSTDEVFVACRDLYVGTVVPGGSCNDARDCKKTQGPTACFATEAMVDPPYLPLGVCRPEPAGKAGDTCFASCPLGADCSTAFVTSDPSQNITLCHEKDGLYCNENHLCAALSPAGGACSIDDTCPAADYCADGDPAATCQPHIAPGATCQFNWTCPTGYSCQDQHCAPRPLADDRSCTSIPRYPVN